MPFTYFCLCLELEKVYILKRCDAAKFDFPTVEPVAGNEYRFHRSPSGFVLGYPQMEVIPPDMKKRISDSHTSSTGNYLVTVNILGIVLSVEDIDSAFLRGLKCSVKEKNEWFNRPTHAPPSSPVLGNTLIQEFQRQDSCRRCRWRLHF